MKRQTSYEFNSASKKHSKIINVTFALESNKMKKTIS